jgi:prenyltransferase beta subunit
MRTRAAAACVALALWSGLPSDDREVGSDELQTGRVTALVARSHAFLVKHQNADGSFSVVRGQSSKNAPVAVTALAALSLMAGGYLPAHGELARHSYDNRVKRAIDWLVEHNKIDGDQAGYFRHDNDSVSRMHGQGYALLALTQAAGMYGDDDAQRKQLHDTVQRAISLVQRTQGFHGGWWYNPERSPNHEGSITVCMIQALRAAKDAGFVVDSGVIQKALQYMRKSQDEVSGRFRYALNDDRMTWPLTAAALATLNAMGDYGSESLQRGFDALRRDDPFTGGNSGVAFMEYGAFYAVQCYWSHQDSRLFQGWWPHFVDACARNQYPDGSFKSGEFGSVYATTMTSLSLQVPFGYLPMFQR